MSQITWSTRNTRSMTLAEHNAFYKEIEPLLRELTKTKNAAMFRITNAKINNCRKRHNVVHVNNEYRIPIKF